MLSNAQRTSTMLNLLIFFLLFRTGFITSAAVVQTKVLETFNAGETITLECFISEKHENYYFWFKQSLGEPPTCILTLYADATTPTFYGDFKNEERLTDVKNKTYFAFIIKESKPSDTGIYYCGTRDYDLITFSNGLFLNYKEPISEFAWTDLKVPVLVATNILCLVIIAILCKRTQKRQETFSETHLLQKLCSSLDNEGAPEEMSAAAPLFLGRNLNRHKRSSYTHVVYSAARGYSIK